MANGIKIGNLVINAFKVASDDTKVYLGDILLYPTTPPTPPAFNGKWKATYTGGTVSTAECDSTSAITTSDGFENDGTLIEIVIGDCVTSIGDSAFYQCSSLTSIDIPNSVTSIGFGAFVYCSGLTSIDIPNSVTSIGQFAFAGCYSITSCTIGSGVTSISDYAFQYCSSLTSVTVNAATPPTLGIDVFDDTNDCPIYVPSGSINTYKSADRWSEYSSRLVAIPE